MESITSLTVGHYGMIIVMPIFIALAFLSYLMTPKPWRKSVQEKTIIIIFHVCGLISLYGLTSWYCELNNSWLKAFINFFQTFYFDFLILSTLILLLIKLLYTIYKKIRGTKTKVWNYRAIWLTTLCIVGLFAFLSMYHDGTVDTTNYTVENNKEKPQEDMKIDMYSDSHFGAGADLSNMGYASDTVNSLDPDLLILGGDIFDGTTSQNNLESFTNSVKNIHPTYGKYFIMGNHDDNCLYDFEKALTDAGVKILKDEAVVLPNGAILIGKDDSTNIEPKQIMDKYSISEETRKQSYIIVAQHRPQRAELYSTQCDLMLCGHTHGYHFPILNPLSMFSDILRYGDRWYGDMYAITSSGLSSWGFHTKWPSYSEIVDIDVIKNY